MKQLNPKSRSLCLFLLLSSFAAAQAHFEFQGPTCTNAPNGYTFPVPCNYFFGDPEGITWNGAVSEFPVGRHPTIDNTSNGNGFPCYGSQFLRVVGGCTQNGPTPVIPAGGPIPAGPPFYSEVYIPVPVGTNLVSFCWDFYSAEGNALEAGSWNDAMSVDAVGVCGGSSLANFVYADTNDTQVLLSDNAPPCGVQSFPPSEREVAPSGPQGVYGLIIPPGSTFLRITVANSSDNGYPSHAVIDGVNFWTAEPPCQLILSAPCNGSLRIRNTPCPSSVYRDYLIGISAAPGNFPNGWFFGLDIPLAELVNQFNFGFPFRGSFDQYGSSDFGPLPCGTLPSVVLWAGVGEWGPGFGWLQGSRPPTMFWIP